MNVDLPGATCERRAVDLRGTDRGRADVRAAIRGEAAWLDAPSPGPLFERVGVVAPQTAVGRREALAAAARSRGLTAPQDDRRRAVRERLADVEVDLERIDTESLRRELAEASAETDRLRERVARLQGRVRAERAGDGSESAEAALADAVRELSERETELTAAEQALGRARERRREHRDARERRRRLEDRAANLDRAARRHLAGELREEYREAVAALPGAPEPDGADRVATALAAYRVGEPDAPVVLACDRLPGPAAAADWLDAPVLRL